MKNRRTLAAALLVAVLAPVAACGTAEGKSGEPVTVTVGYQSKTINTVNAGTLLRSKKFFEKRLVEAGKKSGTSYTVVWKDYDTGAPITAQMLAGKIDIGSMGDFPLLINGSKTGAFPDGRTEFIATTGYNAKGALNSVVVPKDSTAKTLADLAGTKISTSVGSAGHGLLVRALTNAGIKTSGVTVQNQGPAIGASALQAGSVDALSQFVAWPGVLVFKDQARLLYDGAGVNLPTFHGVVARRAFTDGHPEITDAFLKGVIDATAYIHAEPLAAAQSVADTTGLPVEAVYLYNGANGISTFDATIKPLQKDALEKDVPFLKSIGVLKALDLKAFVNDSYIRKAYGADYDTAVASTVNPAAINGKDESSGADITDPATAGEVWLHGETSTHPASTPTSLLKLVKSSQAAGRKVRVAYVPAADSGTRWFADKSIWVRDPAAAADVRFLPFTTQATADAYIAAHAGSIAVTYAAAVAAA